VLANYLDRSSPLLVNFGSRGVTGAAALRRSVPTGTVGRGAPSGPVNSTGRYGQASAATVGGHWQLGAVALFKAVRWNLHLASLLTHLFTYVGCLEFNIPFQHKYGYIRDETYVVI